MKNNGKHIELFTASGCIRPEALIASRDNKLVDKQQKAVDTHLAECLFCSEALEGFEFAGPSELVLKNLEKASERFGHKLDSKKKTVPVLIHPSSFAGRILYGSVAASVLLVMVFLFTLLRQEDALSQAFADGSTIVQADVIPKVPPVKYFEIKEEAIELPPEITETYIADASDEELVEDEVEEVVSFDVADVAYSPSGAVNYNVSPSAPVTNQTNGTSNLIPDSAIFVYEEVVVDMSKDMSMDKNRGKRVNIDAMEIEKMPDRNVHIDGVKTSAGTLNEVVVTASKESKQSNNARMPEVEVYTVVDKMPEFPGGSDSLTSYLHKNLERPSTDMQIRAGATVYTSFVINERGKIKDARIETGFTKNYDKAVLKLIRNMPDWIPGELAGKKVKVRRQLAVDISKFTD